MFHYSSNLASNNTQDTHYNNCRYNNHYATNGGVPIHDVHDATRDGGDDAHGDGRDDGAHGDDRDGLHDAPHARREPLILFQKKAMQ